MIVVFASALDREARSLVTQWAREDVVLLTAEGLSVEGWRNYSDPGARSRAILGGGAVETRSIRGVLVRWPAVLQQELTQIVAEDRAYVADEMTAFLRAWFAQLPCPVLNRPSPISLAGPGWRQEQWIHVAARLGISVQPITRRAVPPHPDGRADAVKPEHWDTPGASVVTLVGERYFGDVHPFQARQARRLAHEAGANLMAAMFSGPERGDPLLRVNPLPRLTEEVADAVLEFFLQPRPDRDSPP
jgi:hypothetical protein